MVLSRNASGEWMPPWAYGKEPHAALIVKSQTADVAIVWQPTRVKAVSGFVADFLESRKETLGRCELASEVNFLYVVLRRAPQRRDDSGEIRIDTPIAEFGYGAPPISPEEWPLMELGSLLTASVAALRDQD